MVAGRRRGADRRDRAGAADGLGRQGGRPPAARAGPPGHRGGAPGPAGDRLPLRHRARPRPPGRVPGRGASARRAPTSGCWPRTSGGRSAAGPTWPTCGAPASARSARPRCAPLDRIGPDAVLTPAQAMRDLDAVTVEPDAAAVDPHRAAPRPGAARRGGRRALGPARRGAGACWPSTRPPAPTGSGRPSCWPGE